MVNCKNYITGDAGDHSEIDFSQTSSYDSFVTGSNIYSYTDANVTTKLFATGAGGGQSNVRSVLVVEVDQQKEHSLS